MKPEPEAVSRDDRWGDLLPVRDRELSRLPDRYRAVLVLCDLEGVTRQEAARQLGVPEGTVNSRLARAPTMRADRLTRCGVALPSGVLVGVFAQSATACVPTAMTATTIRVAVLDLLAAFRRSKAMLAGVTLGVFDALSSGPKAAPALAAELGAHPDALGRLLDALVGPRRLARDPAGYANTPTASAYLTQASPRRLTGYLRFTDEVLWRL